MKNQVDSGIVLSTVVGNRSQVIFGRPLFADGRSTSAVRSGGLRRTPVIRIELPKLVTPSKGTGIFDDALYGVSMFWLSDVSRKSLVIGKTKKEMKEPFRPGTAC